MTVNEHKPVGKNTANKYEILNGFADDCWHNENRVCVMNVRPLLEFKMMKTFLKTILSSTSLCAKSLNMTQMSFATIGCVEIVSVSVVLHYFFFSIHSVCYSFNFCIPLELVSTESEKLSYYMYDVRSSDVFVCVLDIIIDTNQTNYVKM